MRNNRGRRFDDEPKLNIKKVVATVIALLVIIMVIASIIMAINKKSKNQNIVQDIEYFSAYTNNKWTVINSKGEELTSISYDEMVIIPDSTKPVFVVTYDVDYKNGTYKTKVVNEKNEQLFSNYENINAIVNYSSADDIWHNPDVLTFKRDGKYGLIDFSGNEVLTPEYDEIYSLQGIMRNIIVKKDGKMGLFNTASKTMTINPEYIDIEPFGETYNDGYIVKDEKGKKRTFRSRGKENFR